MPKWAKTLIAVLLLPFCIGAEKALILVGREMSPIYHITSNMPPVRVHHGDADTLIPLEQSQWFQAAAQKMGCDVTVKVHPGGDHGWLTTPWDIR